ncbi:MAG: polyketide synthase, partial [Methylovulum sp.]
IGAKVQDAARPAATVGGVAGLTRAYLKNLVAGVIKLPARRIDEDGSFEKYGVDSVMVMALTNELEKSFGLLPKTLLFEYQTIRELADYFVETQQDRLVRLLGLETGEASNTVAAEEIQAPTPVKSMPARRAAPALMSQAVAANVTIPDNADIAIIGLAGQYPGAATLAEFWENLRAGKDCVTEIPAERWDHSAYFDADRYKPGKAYSCWGGFIDDVDQFDSLFFNISPRVADMLDPMVRLFLQTVWNLLEGSGYTRDAIQQHYQSSVGVYVGAMYQQYHGYGDALQKPAVSLSSYSEMANRVSHFFNLQGPSVALDTMCSSALTSIHLACESLRKQECRLAIAGAVNLTIHPDKYLGLSQSQMLGSHAHSRSFADGDGYIPAEGVGAVLLKPLSCAIADGDSILAVIKSTAINHSGHTHGYAVPNPNAQASLIEDNFAKSGIDPRTVSYVEAAAAGSALGDPIELSALTKAFRKFTQDAQFCAIGSVKSNIGHAEAASGMSQLTKVVLQLQHRQLAPSILAEPLNPNLSFADTPFYLQETLADWEQPVVTIDGVTQTYARRATISSFGAGGSNAHLIIEEYIPPVQDRQACERSASPQIIVFSARSRERLQAVVEQMLAFVEQHPALPLSDFAYTLQVGREAMAARLALVVNDSATLVQALKAYLHTVKQGNA